MKELLEKMVASLQKQGGGEGARHGELRRGV